MLPTQSKPRKKQKAPKGNDSPRNAINNGKSILQIQKDTNNIFICFVAFLNCLKVKDTITGANIHMEQRIDLPAERQTDRRTEIDWL